ncbi:MAG TPA: hypothetical protein VFQ61_14105 [Polyangiaceae bacterium]|nr:hypothetical protein [Polyangiaceae bacterium]
MRRVNTVSLISGVLAFVGAGSMLASSCAPTNLGCDAYLTCDTNDSRGGAAGDTGLPGSAGAGGSNGGAEQESGGAAGAGAAGASTVGGNTDCDTQASPSAAPCLVDERYGVFVAPEGDDELGDGSRSAPFGSLQHALEVAVRVQRSRVFACATAGAFEEALAVDEALDGAALYGGFSCDDWSRVEQRTRVESPESWGARSEGLRRGFTAEDIEWVAADAAQSTAEGTAESSVALWVLESKGIVLRRVRLQAGAGGDGAPGEAGQSGRDGAPAPDALSGQDADCSEAAPTSQIGGEWPAEAVACGSSGGAGGQAFKSAVADGNRGSDGVPRTHVTPANEHNAGDGATEVAQNAGSGRQGSNGDRGEPGAAAEELGIFTLEGYEPASGVPGTPGYAGQGGGGGGASKGDGSCLGASGGGGGMGGCGGNPGTGGGGGGASIAVLSWNSSIRIESCELRAGDGGTGGEGGSAGPGGLGSAGAAGGLGDTVAGIGDGGQGGKGGHGGAGGPGSGGSGGPSLALVFKGERPDLRDTDLVLGRAGGAGLGGKAGAERAPSGADAEAREVLEL